MSLSALVFQKNDFWKKQFQDKKQFQSVTGTEKQFQVGTGTVFQLRFRSKSELELFFSYGFRSNLELELKNSYGLRSNLELELKNSSKTVTAVT